MKLMKNPFFSFVLFLLMTSSPLTFGSAKNIPIPKELGQKLVLTYSQIVLESYADALKGGMELKNKIEALIQNPSAETLEAAKTAWKEARDVYSPTEAFRFYGGPIDDPQDGPEGLINAWPMDESYLDYVSGQSGAGIINNTKDYPVINKDLLIAMNEKNGEKNISTGFHALEFLLWGQDLSTDGPGKRPFTDFLPDSPGAARRKETLSLLSALLVEHLTKIHDIWKPGTPGNYADKLAKEPLDESLRRIYTGVIGLSIDEMAGERMTVPLEGNDQENEQDCFSDYTAKDLLNNESGIRRIYFGEYKGVKGPGLHDLVLAIDPSLAKKTKTQIDQATQKLEDLLKTGKSFDQMIATKAKSPERKKLQATISSLEEQARIIAKSGLSMGLILNIQ